jgi:hypothetical protein
MAKQEFLDSLRVARNLFFHPRVQTDSPHLDPAALAQQLARGAIWLTPKSVHGFNVGDFPELSPAQQAELKAAVDEFSTVAHQVPPAAPPTPEQLSAAKTAFTKILTILQPSLPTPVEGDKVEEALKTVTVAFPPWVANWDYELGSAEDGTASVWITIFADEQSAPRKQFGRFALEATKKIHQALSASGIDRWPYIRIRTAVEHKTA